MPDSLRPDPLGPPEGVGVDHDAKTEDLLLTGLDYYFAGDYQQAINVWTRVLFLDRGHARARAYIDRARSALAEQQRESEELLHGGVAAFNRGELELARRLLTSSIDQGGPQELALPLLARLNRLEAAVNGVESAPAPSAGQLVRGRRLASTPARSPSPWVLVSLLMIVALGIAVFVFSKSIDMSRLSPVVTSGSGPVTSPPEERLPLPQPGQIALNRARRLFSMGHPADAMRALELIRPTDPLRADADRLRAEIQRELLLHMSADPGSAGLVLPPAVLPSADSGR